MTRQTSPTPRCCIAFRVWRTGLAGRGRARGLAGSRRRIGHLAKPFAPWYWTDDTVMALSVFDTLSDRGERCGEAFGDPSWQSLLAKYFADRYRRGPTREYGGTAHAILSDIATGRSWREASREAFDGEGSMGNGAAMLVTPTGAYVSDDLDAVVRCARGSAEPIHANDFVKSRETLESVLLDADRNAELG